MNQNRHAAIRREAAQPVPPVAPRRTAAVPGVLLRPARFAGVGRAIGVGLAAAAVLAIVVLGTQVVDLRGRLDRSQLVARDAVDALTARNTADRFSRSKTSVIRIAA